LGLLIDVVAARSEADPEARWASWQRERQAGVLCGPNAERIDAVFTLGQYNLVSWALNSFGVPLDDFLPGAGP
jgi:hypothetical protein